MDVDVDMDMDSGTVEQWNSGTVEQWNSGKSGHSDWKKPIKINVSSRVYDDFT
jgi:hypothetical protein